MRMNVGAGYGVRSAIKFLTITDHGHVYFPVGNTYHKLLVFGS